MKTTVIIPAFNLEPMLEDTVRGIRKYADPDEILIIHDVTNAKLKGRLKKGSNKLKRKYKTYTIFRFNKRGFGSALRLGFEKASGDVVVVSMGDLCDDPRTIKKMEMKIAEGYDMVVGSRYIEGGGVIGNTLKQKISKLVSVLVSTFSRVKCTDITNAFKAYKKEVLRNVKTKSNSFVISFELPIKAVGMGYKIGEVPTVWRNRDFGKSSFRFVDEGWNYLKWFLYSVFTMPSALTIFLVALLVIGIIWLFL